MLAFGMDLPRYLARLELPAKPEVSLARLNLLHERHLLACPFENLDIARRVEIVIDVDRFFEKIVVRRRGGFCYELNGLFGCLLEAAGFRVERIGARVYGPEGTPGIEGDHMALLVEVDGRRYLADVGFGESFRRPLPLEMETEASQYGERYRLVAGGDEIDYQVFDRDAHDWRSTYTFTLAPRDLDFFGPACAHHQTSPESLFTQGRICSKAIPDGRVTLRDDKLILTRGRARTETPIAGDAEFAEALRKHFGIELPSGAGRDA
jgi:N-hydroxyarylamine O-acetyltransferase